MVCRFAAGRRPVIEARQVLGVTKTVFSRGEMIVEEGKYVGRKGQGPR